MGSAFKCERCDELYEGTSERIKAQTFTKGMVGDVDHDTLLRSELCETCLLDFVDAIKPFGNVSVTVEKNLTDGLGPDDD
jgi:hypothetical protein